MKHDPSEWGAKEAITEHVWTQELFARGIPSAMSHQENNDYTIGTQILAKALSVWDKAEVVVWRAPIWQAAIAGTDAFVGALFDQNIYRPAFQFWVTDGFYDCSHPAIMDDMGLDVPCTLNTFLLIPICRRHHARSNNWIYMLEEGDKDSDVGLFGVNILVPNAGIEDNQPAARLRYFWLLYGDRIAMQPTTLAASAFLQQDFVTTERERPNRAARRRLERLNVHESEVSVVTLRRARYTGSGGEGDREWQHQWMVRGHWRKPSPLMKEPRPVYVRPHVKGPEDKPLLTPKRPVFVASR